MYLCHARTSKILRSYIAPKKISMESCEIVRCATPIDSIVCFNVVGFASKDLHELSNKYDISFIKKIQIKGSNIELVEVCQKFKKPNHRDLLDMLQLPRRSW
jgi:hypothetical protein